MAYPVYAEIVHPASKAAARLVDAALVAGFSLLIALSAQVAIPLPFTPVPLTLQTMVVLATGALLGSKRGAAAVLAYLAEGAAGLPVFSMGRAGIAHMLGPTGGYLIGFILAAFLCGLLSEKGWDRKGWTAFAGLLISDIVLFVPGVIWLGAYTGFSSAIVLGALPFVAADVVKCALSAAALPLGWKMLARK